MKDSSGKEGFSTFAALDFILCSSEVGNEADLAGFEARTPLETYL